MGEDWVDITIPVDESLAVWPGDTPYHLTVNDWGSVRVGAITMSVHAGTHADAPFHFLAGAAAIAALDPGIYVGECVVIDAATGPTIGPEAFAGIALAPRTLLRTLAWTDHAVFPESVPTLTGEAIAHLASAGVRLLGVDVPSVDAIDSKDLPNHHALAAAGIHILESLDLRGVTPGRYELIALPLRLAGADGSPVRAVVRRTVRHPSD